MKRHRFIITSPLSPKTSRIDDAQLVHQIHTVLRLKKDEELIVCNGDGNDYYFSIQSLSKKEVVISYLRTVPSLPEQPTPLTLYMSLIKPDAFDMVLQKATELGVATIVPVISERTIRKTYNLNRATQIVREAAEQCGRGALPTLREPLALHEAMQEWGSYARIFFADTALDTKPISYAYGQSIALVIGPEGGWTNTEREMIKNTNHTDTISLSPFILRAETAALAGITLLLSGNNI